MVSISRTRYLSMHIYSLFKTATFVVESSGLKLLHGIAVLIIIYYKVHHWNQEEDESWRNIKDDTTITMMWILSSLLYFTHIYYQEYNALKSFQKALHVLCEENMIFSILGTSL